MPKPLSCYKLCFTVLTLKNSAVGSFYLQTSVIKVGK